MERYKVKKHLKDMKHLKDTRYRHFMVDHGIHDATSYFHGLPGPHRSRSAEETGAG